jgi:hypothetical protein
MIMDQNIEQKIILVKDDDILSQKSEEMTNHHDNNIPIWIHEQGIDAIISKTHTCNAHKFTDDIERKR